MNNTSNEKFYEILGLLPESLNAEPASPRDLIQTVAQHLIQPERFAAADYRAYDLNNVLAYLRKSHVYYLDKKLPEIDQNMHHLHQIFPKERLFHILNAFFQQYKTLLIEHIDHEENTVFNYVDYLLTYRQLPSEQELKTFLLGNTSLSGFLDSHTDTENDLTAMRQLLGDSDQYKQLHPISLLLNQIASLENHLNIHARIEDEVFIPKAMELEDQLNKKHKSTST
ncbi:MAG: hypothetical protein ACQERC_02055 [Bacteroidota bacterium]